MGLIKRLFLLFSRSKKILCVDDESGVFEVIKLSFKDQNAVVFHASNAFEAVDIVAKQKFDIIILDLNLGKGVDGKHLINYFYKHNLMQKILIFSGSIQNDIDLPVAHIINKPNLNELKDLIFN